MAWDKVGGGTMTDGVPYIVERHVIYFQVPRSGVLPIRLRSYRWRALLGNHQTRELGRAKSRAELEAMIKDHQKGGPRLR